MLSGYPTATAPINTQDLSDLDTFIDNFEVESTQTDLAKSLSNLIDSCTRLIRYLETQDLSKASEKTQNAIKQRIISYQPLIHLYQKYSKYINLLSSNEINQLKLNTISRLQRFALRSTIWENSSHPVHKNLLKIYNNLKELDSALKALPIQAEEISIASATTGKRANSLEDSENHYLPKRTTNQYLTSMVSPSVDIDAVADESLISDGLSCFVETPPDSLKNPVALKNALQKIANFYLKIAEINPGQEWAEDKSKDFQALSNTTNTLSLEELTDWSVTITSHHKTYLPFSSDDVAINKFVIEQLLPAIDSRILLLKTQTVSPITSEENKSNTDTDTDTAKEIEAEAETTINLIDPLKEHTTISENTDPDESGHFEYDNELTLGFEDFTGMADELELESLETCLEKLSDYYNKAANYLDQKKYQYKSNPSHSEKINTVIEKHREKSAHLKADSEAVKTLSCEELQSEIAYIESLLTSANKCLDTQNEHTPPSAIEFGIVCDIKHYCKKSLMLLKDHIKTLSPPETGLRTAGIFVATASPDLVTTSSSNQTAARALKSPGG